MNTFSVVFKTLRSQLQNIWIPGNGYEGFRKL